MRQKNTLVALLLLKNIESVLYTYINIVKLIIKIFIIINKAESEIRLDLFNCTVYGPA